MTGNLFGNMMKDRCISLARLAVLSAITLAASSCSKDDFAAEELLPSQNAVSVNGIEFSPLGGEHVFTVTSDSEWTVTGIPSWLTLVAGDRKSPLGNGDTVKAGTISLKATTGVNTEHTGQGTSRQAELAFHSDCLDARVTLKQPCPYFVVLSSADGLTGHDSVAFPWNYTSEQPFGSEGIKFTVLSNTDWTLVKETAASVEMDYKKYSRRNLTAAGSGPESFAAAGSGVEDGWLVSPAPGEYELNEDGEWEFLFVPETYNATGRDRALTLRFVGASDSYGRPLDEYVVDFSQKNVRFNVSVDADYSLGYLEFEAAHPDPVNFMVDSEIDWYVEKDASWLSTEPATPRGTGLDADSPSSSFSLNMGHEGCSGNANPARVMQSSALRIVGVAGTTLLPQPVNVRQKAYVHSLSAYGIQIGNDDLSVHRFDVISSGEWTLSGTADWLSADPVSGNGGTPDPGSETVSVNALSQNLEFTARTAALRIESALNPLSAPVTVTQDPYIFTAEAENLSLNTLSTDSYILSIRSSGKWSVDVSYEEPAEPGWLNVSQTSGTGDLNISYGASSVNEETVDRVAVISVRSVTHEEAGVSADPLQMRIMQRKYTFELSPLPETAGVLAFTAVPDESRTIDVSCSHTWEVSAPDWISVTPASGSGDGRVVIKPQNNLTKSGRSGTFTISSTFRGRTYSHTYTVTQSAFVFNVTGTSFTDLAPFQTGSHNTSVECSGDWKVEIPSSASSWISATPSSGKSTDRSIAFNVASNVLKSSRSADVRIYSVLGDYSETVHFQQNRFVFDETAVYMTAETLSPGTTQIPITISEGAPWSTENQPSWVTVSPSSGAGSGEVTVAVADNYQLSTRSSSDFGIRASGSSLLKPINITQKSFVYDTTPMSLSEFSELNSLSRQFIMGTCMGSWSVENVPSWASFSISGSFVIVRASDNLTTSVRSAELSVESQYVAYNSALKKKVSISQAAFVFDGTAADLSFEAMDSKPNVVPVTISATAPWEVTGVPSWITATPASGNGSGNLTLSCEANYALSQRSVGDMYVKSKLNGLTKKLSVIQKAFVFDTKAVTVPRFAASEAESLTVTVGECMGSWSVKDVPSWLTVSTAGSVLTITASDNTESSVRSATFRVESAYVSKNPELVKKITVSQEGKQ